MYKSLSIIKIVHRRNIIDHTGLLSFVRISCGHIEGVSAEKGPPGVGTNPSDSDGEKCGVAPTVVDSSVGRTYSPSSSDNVSTKNI